MDRGVCRVIVHGVSKSWTWLSDKLHTLLTTTSAIIMANVDWALNVVLSLLLHTCHIILTTTLRGEYNWDCHWGGEKSKAEAQFFRTQGHHPAWSICKAISLILNLILTHPLGLCLNRRCLEKLSLDLPFSLMGLCPRGIVLFSFVALPTVYWVIEGSCDCLYTSRLPPYADLWAQGCVYFVFQSSERDKHSVHMLNE